MKCQSKSCLCYSLEHGAVIIGITFMMSSAIALIAEVGMILQWNDMKIHFKNDTMKQCQLSLLRKKTLKVHISILFFSSFLPFPYCQCCIEWGLLNFFNIVTERNQRSELLVNFNLKKKNF